MKKMKACSAKIYGLSILIALLSGMPFVTSNQTLGQMHGGGGGGGMGPGGGGGMFTTLTTFQTDDFAGSGVCALCHSGLSDAAGYNVSIDAHWRSTMMGNSAKDPLWQAKIITLLGETALC